VGEPPAGRIVRLDVAVHEAATVIVNQRRQRARGAAPGPVAAEMDLPVPTREAAVMDFGNLRRGGFAVLAHLVNGGAADLVGQGVELGTAFGDRLVHQVEQRAGFVVEHLDFPLNRTDGGRRTAPAHRLYG